ncbi:uncharacterized protein LOC129805919 isoform X2 [Phlebotomus papatasi]|uniref:uncharacterized protein LOC129805919 isoform X2 n=1 Tax=Phlebotomus papatasi TaxID=29031 RepID=UPI00248407D0|nr:uncharacterized protein LOC129805919 isoform X2 [Phlebotomus papatasi]
MPPRRGRKRKATTDDADTPCTIVDTVETANVPEWFRRSNVNSLVKRKITTLFPGDSDLAENKEFQEKYLEYFYKLYTEKPTSRRHPDLRLSELHFRDPPMSREDIRHCFLNNIYMLECRVDMTKRNLYLKCEKHSYMNFMNKYESYRNAEAFPSFRRLSHRTMKYVNKYMSKFLRYLENLEEKDRLRDQGNSSTESSAEDATAKKSSAAPRSVKLRRLQEEKEKQKVLDESENRVLAGPKKRVRFLESDEEDSDELRESAVAALYNLDGMPPEFREECEKILRDADDATKSASKPGPSRIKSSAAPLSVKLQRVEQEQRRNLSAQQKKSAESHPESEEASTEYDQAAVEALYNEVYNLGDSEILAELEEIDCQTPQKTVPLEMNKKKKSQPRSQAIDDEKENRTMDMSDSEDDFVFCNLPKKRKNLKNISNIAPPPKKKPPVTIKKPKAAPLSVKRHWEATNKDTQSANQSQNILSQKSNSSENNDNDGNNNSVSMDISCISDDGFHLNLHTARENNEDLLGSIPLTGQGLSQEVPECFISSTPNFRPDILTVRLNDDRLLNSVRIHRDIRSYVDGGMDRIEENSLNESDTSAPSSCDREPIEISGSSARFDKDKTTQDLLESSNDSSDTESDTNQDEDNSSNIIVLVNLREEFKICFEDWGEYLFANFEQLMNTFVLQNLPEYDDDVEAISESFPPRTELVCVEDLSQRMSQLNNAQDPLYFTQ